MKRSLWNPAVASLLSVLAILLTSQTATAGSAGARPGVASPTGSNPCYGRLGALPETPARPQLFGVTVAGLGGQLSMLGLRKSEIPRGGAITACRCPS